MAGAHVRRSSLAAHPEVTIEKLPSPGNPNSLAENIVELSPTGTGKAPLKRETPPPQLQNTLRPSREMEENRKAEQY